MTANEAAAWTAKANTRGLGTSQNSQSRDHRSDAKSRVRDQSDPHRSPLLFSGPVQFKEPSRPDAQHGAADDAEQEPAEQEPDEFIATGDHHQ